jgi:hypothetical protein
LGSGVAVIGWVWIGLVVFCCTAAIHVRLDRTRRVGRRDRKTAAFFVGLKATGLPTQVWYYVPLMTAVVPMLDATVWLVTTTKARRMGRLVLVLVIAVMAALPGWRQVRERQTNVDRVASLLGTHAGAGDVIVVHPWYYGVSFRRYYTGSASWVTIPPMDDIRIHRYDLLKATMVRSNPIDSILDAVAKTLKSGHRVWLVGGLPFLRSGELPLTLPPAPNSNWGWNNGPYLVAWAQQAAYFLQTHAQGAEIVPVPTSGPIRPHENVPVAVVWGWRR